jgi:type III secretory pathway component EscU
MHKIRFCPAKPLIIAQIRVFPQYLFGLRSLVELTFALLIVLLIVLFFASMRCSGTRADVAYPYANRVCDP